MNKLFGTDGVRGVANTELTCELAMNIGKAAGMVLSEYCQHKPTFIIGKDTRISSDMLENALASGLCSVGANVTFLGIIPTPAVAHLVTKYNADAGFMISASHNPMEYNGIKIFNKDGYKLPDHIEQKIENVIHSQKFNLKLGKDLGKISFNKNAIDDYISHIKLIANNTDFSNIKVAIDCANGSASLTAKQLFNSLGIDCLIINNKPNGININENCGSTHINTISQFVKEHQCDIGLSFDGDADRCLIVDENGSILDGDKIIAIISKYLKDNNLLTKNTFVVTDMSNFGLIKMAQQNNINVEKTPVGDRYVLEKMRQFGYCIGGESSGHIILSQYTTTGDGQLIAIYFLKIISELKQKVSILSKIMVNYPQILINIPTSNSKKYNILNDHEINRQIKYFENKLGDNGRILIRPSGTEPLIRIMVEGIDKTIISQIANNLSSLMIERLKN